jgi:hypothetical protein
MSRIFDNACRLGEQIHAIATVAGEVWLTPRRIEAGVPEGAVADAKLHQQTI